MKVTLSDMCSPATEMERPSVMCNLHFYMMCYRKLNHHWLLWVTDQLSNVHRRCSVSPRKMKQLRFRFSPNYPVALMLTLHLFHTAPATPFTCLVAKRVGGSETERVVWVRDFTFKPLNPDICQNTLLPCTQPLSAAGMEAHKHKQAWKDVENTTDHSWVSADVFVFLRWDSILVCVCVCFKKQGEKGSVIVALIQKEGDNRLGRISEKM